MISDAIQPLLKLISEDKPPQLIVSYGDASEVISSLIIDNQSFASVEIIRKDDSPVTIVAADASTRIMLKVCSDLTNQAIDADAFFFGTKSELAGHSIIAIPDGVPSINEQDLDVMKSAITQRIRVSRDIELSKESALKSLQDFIGKREELHDEWSNHNNQGDSDSSGDDVTPGVGSEPFQPPVND